MYFTDYQWQKRGVECVNTQRRLEFMLTGDWVWYVDELTDELRQVVEDLYGVKTQNSDSSIKFVIDKDTLQPQAILEPFSTQPCKYDILLEEDEVEMCTTGKYLELPISLSRGGITVRHTLEARIPDEVTQLMKDCGLAREQYYSHSYVSFVCRT